MLLICFGTRPEWIKIKPLIKCFKGNIQYRLLFTGQHVDLLNNIDEYIQRLSIVNGPNRLDSIVTSLLNNNDVFEGITSILVQGDTTSVLAMALAGFHRKIKVIHLEAGLRTYDRDNPFPEETNRQLVSRLADIHLCPTQKSYDNLQNELAPGKKFIVGNTVLDNLVDLKTSYSNNIIVTLHRRENHDIMNEWFNAVNNLAIENKDYNFIIPLHPNPNVKKWSHILTDVNIVDPIQYEQFVDLISDCRLLITDSGGIQEEASFLRKKCIVCRKVTEREESLGTFSFLAKKPSDLRYVFYEHINNFIPDSSHSCPYGDGQASQKIMEILKNV